MNKSALKKMKERLLVLAETEAPKPTCVATRYEEGLLFEGRLWPDFQSIHAAHPGRFDLYHDGVELTVVDGRIGQDATPSYYENIQTINQ